ncbi:MAG: chorismate-binding protein [Ignavibacteria bacterium]|nr:chorismate-binding protein [Ignavibacteria bacterium]MBT8382934.1 chorismate-binding protein [Ignavibacteria bacterium]MBT8391899.1 chorismate-binding protein [Ignavibacteria bacterium]NNJ53307.1 chorismate-binding protein [Ignavibacteriaceae bacterium]NNL22245.1 chorismate-binding protein [Ignavibacteriaceae bacterium]
MQINVQNIVGNFNSFINSLDEFTNQHLVSFVFQVDKFDLLSSLNPLSIAFKKIFLFQSPGSKYSFVALNSATKLSESGHSNISETIENYEFLKKSFINNWNEFQLDSLPIICTAIKFDPQKISDDWNNFNSINIFIPELAFYTNNGNTYGCFNFIDSEKPNIQKYFSSLLNTVIQITNEKTSEDKKVNGYNYIETEDEKEQWLKTSREAIDVLSNDKIQKLVISRSHSFNLVHNPNFKELLQKLTNRFPDCYLFYLKQSESHFFGSSPEMFLKIFGNLAEVESVAGSAPRGKKYDSDEKLEEYLKSSKKNHKEHEFVTDFISNTLKKFSDKVKIKEEKRIKKLDNIQHLTTKISAELKSNVHIFKIVDSLFPTPAVCGLPKNEAMEIIRKLETHDRGLYSGLIGWMDFDGNCELAVSIRSTLVKNNNVTAYAGAGLVKVSNPEDEFLETKLKLDPILSLFKLSAAK